MSSQLTIDWSSRSFTRRCNHISSIIKRPSSSARQIALLLYCTYTSGIFWCSPSITPILVHQNNVYENISRLFRGSFLHSIYDGNECSYSRTNIRMAWIPSLQLSFFLDRYKLGTPFEKSLFPILTSLRKFRNHEMVVGKRFSPLHVLKLTVRLFCKTKMYITRYRNKMV